MDVDVDVSADVVMGVNVVLMWKWRSASVCLENPGSFSLQTILLLRDVRFFVDFLRF